MEDRTHKLFNDEDIQKVAGTYHEWRTKNGKYEDIKGFCKSVKLEEIQKHNYILTPGRYVGIMDEEDDGIPFEEKITELTEKLKVQITEEKRLNEKIKESLESIGFEL
jgi:type I restriction enzyme M protein